MQGLNVVVHTAALGRSTARRNLLDRKVDGTGSGWRGVPGESSASFISLDGRVRHPDHTPDFMNRTSDGVGPYGRQDPRRGTGRRIPTKGCVSDPAAQILRGPSVSAYSTLCYDWAKDGRGFPLIGSVGTATTARRRGSLRGHLSLHDEGAVIVNDTLISGRAVTDDAGGLPGCPRSCGFRQEVVGLPAGPASCVKF